MTTRTHAFLLLPAALAGTLLLASCGTDGGESAQPSPEASKQATAEFNDTDVMFAQMMIPHHEQAVEMSRLAEDRAGDDVKELADEIEAAQGPEIKQLTTMLESWGEEPADDMSGMGHDMDGMMSEEQMNTLESTEGDAFDTMFLEMMIEHHEGAVGMAEKELDKGTNPKARELAQDVIDAQESEIDQMNRMLGNGGESGGEPADQGDGQGHGGH